MRCSKCQPVAAPQRPRALCREPRLCPHPQLTPHPATAQPSTQLDGSCLSQRQVTGVLGAARAWHALWHNPPRVCGHHATGAASVLGWEVAQWAGGYSHHAAMASGCWGWGCCTAMASGCWGCRREVAAVLAPELSWALPGQPGGAKSPSTPCPGAASPPLMNVDAGA